MRITIPGKGTLQGTTLLDPTRNATCHRFSRVPYALSPQRWKNPEPLPNSFSYNGQYTKPSSICPQPRVFGRQSTIHDEDCLQSNIYVPLGNPPGGGWPVLFYIHGGFLQFGSNNYDDPSALLNEIKCVVVSPAYRLGLFGFLASNELQGNFGLWDLRSALEWTYDNIEYFGGNKNNITVGGLSAGSYATFQQLAYDMKSDRQLIRRVFQWSNGCGVQPKQLPETQQQFENLVHVMQIPRFWTNQEKLDALREKPADELISAVEKLKQKFFRPVSDGHFISKDLFENIRSGKFGQRMRDLGIQTVIGDLTQEFHLYKNVYPPKSYHELVNRLSWDYPQHIAATVCKPFKSSRKSEEEWKDIFGRIYADMQIHSTMRGFVQSISSALPLSHIHRYRIDWRTQSVDKRLPKEIGATHATDLSIWLFGNGEPLTDSEKVIIREFLKPIESFVNGDPVKWGTQSLDEVRNITAEGKIEIKKDEVWDEKLPLWELTKAAIGSQQHSKSLL